MQGGTERWNLDFCELSGCDLTGIVVIPGAQCHAETVKSLARFMPIHACGIIEQGNWRGLSLASPSTSIIRHPGWKSAFDAACHNADILILWGLNQEADHLKGMKLPRHVVTISHGDNAWTKNWIDRSLPFTTDFAAVSDIAVTAYPQELQSRVKVIRNGVNPSRCVSRESRAILRERWGIPRGATAVGYIGRFSNEKDPAATIRAVANLPSNYFAVLMGSGLLDTSLSSQAASLIPGRHVFLPFDPHVGDLLSALDCIVVGSPSEGFCYVIAEAWIAQCPVVSTRVGIIPEMERVHGKLSWPIEVADQGRGIAVAVRLATGGDQSSREVVDRAFRVAWNELTAPRMAMQWRRYFEELLI